MLIEVNEGKFDAKYLVTFKSRNPYFEGVVSVHNTKRGPALGGCRVYEDIELDVAVNDALELAKAMTYKNAITNLPYGGGKAVIIKHGLTFDQVAPSFAKIMNLLNGEYLTTEDVGTNNHNMDVLRRYSRYVVGAEIVDPIPSAAYGVYQTIRATVHSYEGKSLQGFKIAVQGLGKLGFYLCQFLYDAGCLLYVCDVKKELEDLAISKFKAIPFAMENIENLDIDVFSPCALGNVITQNNYSTIKAKYIIGGANNPLSDDSISELLYQKNIIYIPDFLSNAGGVIEVDCENHDFEYNSTNILERVEKVIYNKTLDLLKESQTQHIAPLKVAQEWVKKILDY